MTCQWVDELSSRPTIRPREWAEMSGMAPSTVYDAIKAGSLPSIKLGSAIYIPTAPLLKMLGVAT